MSQDVIINLGRRLVDVRFFHGHVDSAIDLAEDVLYNLRQVYGPSHHSAVQIMNLLSSIYMSKGDRAAAMAVHETADQGAPKVGSAGELTDDVVPANQDDNVVRSRIERLLQQYHDGDGSDKSVRHSASLIDKLTKRLGPPPPDTNRKRVKEHQPPSTWSFAEGEDEDQFVKVKELA